MLEPIIDKVERQNGEEVGGRPATLTCVKEEAESRKRNPMLTTTMEEIADERNLSEAFREVEKNSGAPGIDGESIREVKSKLGKLLPELSRCLLDGSYKAGEIRRVYIPKGDGGKRGLGIPNVIDRIVQQAIHRRLQPQFEPVFHESSHGFRPRRGAHTAIEEAKGYLEEGYEYVVDIDLERFFDTVNHDRLVNQLEARLADRRITRLIRKLLRARVVMPEGETVTNEEGVPQGGPLSPLLSNIVLHSLDEELSRRGHKFVRYADDCNIYVRSERAGHRVMASISLFIEKHLKLKVNRKKSAVERSGGRHFLGFTLRRGELSGEVEVGLSTRSRKRIAAKIVELTPRNWGSTLEKCIERINRYLQGWMAYFHIVTRIEERRLKSLDSHIRRRLRATKLKQWKRKRNIAKALIGLGISAKTAWKIYRGKSSFWALSNSWAVERGLRNSYFTERGLKSLTDLWAKYQPSTTDVAC